MKYCQITKLFVAFVVILISTFSAYAKPNIVTVFIDDMGWTDLSCFGGKVVETTNIDRLCDEGIKFTNFYVMSPICSPSRVALHTGQYPQRWKITSYLSNRRHNAERGVDQWLSLKAPSLPKQLNKAGYATGHFGKWHMGGQRDVGDAPLITKYGFDESLTNFEGLGARVLPLKDAYDGKPVRKHDLGSGNLGRGPIRWVDRSIVTAAFVTDAVKFIDEAQKEKKPFFINLWPDDVHSPFFPPKVLRDKTNKSKRALYYAVLKAMDNQLGVLFDRIRNDKALKDNTIIVIASDNGHEEGAGSSDPLRGAKTWLYEGGVRSPLIVWAPKLMNKNAVGTTNKTSILCSLDLNRSIYALTGAPLPEGTMLDGEDLSRTLLGYEQKSRVQPIFFRRPPDRPGTKQQDNPDLAVRVGKWKYMVNYDGSGAQLYDLSKDISESENVVKQHPIVVTAMHKALMGWNEELPIDAGDPAWKKDTETALPAGEFVNPIAEGADPWVVNNPLYDPKSKDKSGKNAPYLWCMSDGNLAIAIHTSHQLTSIGKKHIVWRAPKTGMVSKQLWAPELHFLDNRWHVYFAASDGKNENHLAYVLRSKTTDPTGEYELLGPFATGEGADGKSPNIWAIDMTVLEHEGKRYALWSGWDAPGTDRQYLYIAPMKSAVELAGPRVLLCANDDYLWERVEPSKEHRGLNEGPQVLQVGGKTHVVYSCGASWLPTYKLGLLTLTGDDPMNPEHWKKRGKPVFARTQDTYGVGHSCFVKSVDGKEWWHVFHAKRDPNPGWRRAIFVQPMRVNQNGFPVFGKPVKAGVPMLRPSGEVVDEAELPVSMFSGKGDGVKWSYYGHHQFMVNDGGKLQLGRVPGEGINDYRAGEKILLDARLPDDYVAEVTMDFHGKTEGRGGGILFRCTAGSVGYDAHRGYFVGLIPGDNLLMFGKMDGTNWRELKRVKTEIDPKQLQRLKVMLNGREFTFFQNDKKLLTIEDKTYEKGSAGLRVVNRHVTFSDFKIKSR